MKCRHCNSELKLPLVDLGTAPPSNAYLTAQQLHGPELWFPLRVLVCESCWLVQTEDFTRADALFDADYAYFSCFSSSWLTHCERYVTNIIERFHLDHTSHVVEVAANDGYLLQYVRDRGIPCLGIEPTASTAAAARNKGIPIVEQFFGTDLAKQLANQGQQADLMVANNVLAHVPDINDFVAGFATLLKPQGIVTFEFPHLLRLIEETQFDTIYHEHFSYFSFATVEKIFAHHSLTLFDVEELTTHGGSLRIYGKHDDHEKLAISDHVSLLKNKEHRAGLDKIETYLHFSEQVKASKRQLLSFLIEVKNTGKTIVGYGAPAKGNTLLNYCGIGTDFLDYTCDRSPHKQGLFLPGTHIPIYHPDKIAETKPDYILILPWNLKDEIRSQLSYIREWGGKFVVPIPVVEVLK